MTQSTAETEDLQETEETPVETVKPRIVAGRSLIDKFDDDRDTSSDSAEWMLTYLDVITLIVTLFVVLISISQIQEQNQIHDAPEVRGEQAIDLGPDHLDITDKTAPIKDPLALNLRGVETLAMIKAGIAEQGLPKLVDVRVIDNQINLEIKDSVLFESGQAELTPAGRTVIEKLRGILTRGEYGISVEGHTDNVPISTSRFPSNWDLSTGRASTVVRALISSGIKPARLEATGHADTRPVVDNTTPENQARNRRVNIVLQIGAR